MSEILQDRVFDGVMFDFFKDTEDRDRDFVRIDSEKIVPISALRSAVKFYDEECIPNPPKECVYVAEINYLDSFGEYGVDLLGEKQSIHFDKRSAKDWIAKEKDEYLKTWDEPGLQGVEENWNGSINEVCKGERTYENECLPIY
jgi:hypothetical protein